MPQPHYEAETVHGPRRRMLSPGAALALLLLLVIVPTGCAGASHTLNDKGSSTQPSAHGTTQQPPVGGWPPHGQAAYVLGDGRPVASPHEQPVPIASVAKVMTAFIVLKHHPLDAGDNGLAFVVGESDVADTEMRRGENQSVVDVRAGEQLTERDALMAILLPSANNIAVLVARQIDGSVASFVTEMNQTAHALGMSETTYTDPSGFDTGTVSTALDQLRLAQVAAADPTLAAMMATSSYPLPVAGTVTNTDALLGQDGFVGMKTGSTDAAGGCFMFRSERHTEDGDLTMIGVVLGQPGEDQVAAGLNAARALVDRVAPNAAASPPLVTASRQTLWALPPLVKQQPYSVMRSVPFAGEERSGRTRETQSRDTDHARTVRVDE